MGKPAEAEVHTSLPSPQEGAVKDQKNSSNTCRLEENSKRGGEEESRFHVDPQPPAFFSQRAFCSEKLNDSDSRSQIQDRKASLCSRRLYCGRADVGHFFCSWTLGDHLNKRLSVPGQTLTSKEVFKRRGDFVLHFLFVKRERGERGKGRGKRDRRGRGERQLALLTFQIKEPKLICLLLLGIHIYKFLCHCGKKKCYF